MFSKKCRNFENHYKNNVFERLQVEGVNGKRCQGNIKNDANKHNKINGKTMLDLCSTNDVEILEETKTKPKVSQQMTNSMQKHIRKARLKKHISKHI